MLSSTAIWQRPTHDASLINLSLRSYGTTKKCDRFDGHCNRWRVLRIYLTPPRPFDLKKTNPTIGTVFTVPPGTTEATNVNYNHLPCRSYCKTCICFQLLMGFHQCIWQRLEGFLRRGRRYGLYPADQPTFALLAEEWRCWRYPFPQSKIFLPPSPPHPFTWINHSSISFKI